MNHAICSVRDSATDSFQRPFFVPAVAVAARVFGDECRRASDDNPICGHPEDFELFELGTFDDSNGKFTMLDSPRSIARAVDFKREIK